MGKKKVLIFIPKFPVRTETFIKREVEKLISRGNVDISVLSLEKGGGNLSKKTEDRINYVKLRVSDVVFGKLKFLFTRPVRFFKALNVVGLGNLYIFIKGLGYANIFSRYKPDIIYAHFLSKPSSVALVSSILIDVEFAISAHARDILEYPDLVKQKTKYSKFIAICNKNAYEKAKELSGVDNPGNIKLIYHGLDPGDLLIDKKIKKEQPPLIFCIGRYVEKKGIEYLIEAAKLLKDEDTDFKLVIAGGGPLKNKFKNMIDEYDLNTKIDLLDSISFEDVKSFYHKSSVYVQPSINTDKGDADGIPNTLIESAMLKIPIVTTNAGSILDFLDDNSAKIVPQGDFRALAEAILEVLEDKQGQNNVRVEKAFRKAIEMFNIDRNVEEIERLLES